MAKRVNMVAIAQTKIETEILTAIIGMNGTITTAICLKTITEIEITVIRGTIAQVSEYLEIVITIPMGRAQGMSISCNNNNKCQHQYRQETQFFPRNINWRTKYSKQKGIDNKYGKTYGTIFFSKFNLK